MRNFYKKVFVHRNDTIFFFYTCKMSHDEPVSVRRCGEGRGCVPDKGVDVQFQAQWDAREKAWTAQWDAREKSWKEVWAYGGS